MPWTHGLSGKVAYMMQMIMKQAGVSRDLDMGWFTVIAYYKPGTDSTPA